MSAFVVLCALVLTSCDGSPGTPAGAGGTGGASGSGGDFDGLFVGRLCTYLCGRQEPPLPEDEREQCVEDCANVNPADVPGRTLWEATARVRVGGTEHFFSSYKDAVAECNLLDYGGELELSKPVEGPPTLPKDDNVRDVVTASFRRQIDSGSSFSLFRRADGRMAGGGVFDEATGEEWFFDPVNAMIARECVLLPPPPGLGLLCRYGWLIKAGENFTAEFSVASVDLFCSWVFDDNPDECPDGCDDDNACTFDFCFAGECVSFSRSADASGALVECTLDTGGIGNCDFGECTTHFCESDESASECADGFIEERPCSSRCDDGDSTTFDACLEADSGWVCVNELGI